MTQWKRPYKLYILAILCTILWGSAIPLIKLGYAVFDIATDATADKLLFAGIRFLGAGLIILVPYFIFCKKMRLPRGFASVRSRLAWCRPRDSISSCTSVLRIPRG